MERALRTILQRIGLELVDGGFPSVEIQIPREEAHGDLSTPMAMGLSKTLKRAPRQIADDITARMQAEGIFDKVEIAGPGFINVRFSRQFLADRIRTLFQEGDSLLTEDIGEGRRIQIEFVSANPTGPLHLGHGRGAALGAAVANLLSAAGYVVEREFYINDAGRQVRLLGESVFAKYKELLGVEWPFPEDGYRGDYIEDLARQFRTAEGDRFSGADFDTAGRTVIDFAYLRMLGLIRTDLADFGVYFDAWQSERELYANDEVNKAIFDLRERGYIFEQDGAIWFRSTDFGDDKDRVLIKKDGDYTYFTPDIAYHRKKFKKGFDELIDIWGADHHGYIPRMQAAIQALGHPKESFLVLLVQMVSLLKGGQPFQMSKRAGQFITLREIMDEIGPDTTKFLFLTRRSDSHLEIDIEVAKAQSNENPVYYVQYAHARINSLFEKARVEAGILIEETEDFDGSLFGEEDLRLVRKLLTYPMVFRGAALSREPHRITFYLQELAGLFHQYYHRNRVIMEEREMTVARLALCRAVKLVIRHGLSILGVSTPEKM